MALRVIFTKQLAAASSTNIAASQSASAGVPLVLNGSATNYLSTTTTAAVAPGGVIIPLTSVAGLTVGQSVTDTTAAVLPTGTVIKAISAASVTIWPPVGGAGVGSGDTIVFPGTAIIDAATAADSETGRRVVLAYTGTDTTFAITGTNSSGNVVTDNVVGGSGAAQSNLDFVTVTGIVPVGGGLTSLTVGTNGVGSSRWVTWNWRGYSPMNISAAVELVSGSVNYTVEYTFDDPNHLSPGVSFPLPLSDLSPAALIAASATKDGLFNFPLVAMRVTINSGTGEIRTRFEQAGAG